jgi:hypothetical protein
LQVKVIVCGFPVAAVAAEAPLITERADSTRPSAAPPAIRRADLLSLAVVWFGAGLRVRAGEVAAGDWATSRGARMGGLR